MITKPFASRQIDRLAGQPFYPREKMALAELINTLGSVAEDEDHAKDIVAKCLEIVDENENPRMATCQDIRRIGYETRRTELRPRPDCPTCSGQGWTFTERTRVWNGRETTVSGAERCSCWTPARKAAAVDGRSMASDPELARLASARTLR